MTVKDIYNMTTIQERKKCTYCKVNLLLTEFKPKRNGTTTKRCIKCLDYSKKWQRKNKDKYKCEHNRKKSRCKECGGSSICEHNRIKSSCRECPNASQICEHNRQKSQCKDCKGGSICEHNRVKSQCKECPNSSQICQHNRQRSYCKDCGGGSICVHNKRKSTCQICDPHGHLAGIVRNSIYRALKSDKEKHSLEYLGCSKQHFKEHIEKQFTEGMTWDNHGEWHIDHIVPLKYDNPTFEQTIERIHWENTQPMWATDNISKGNRFIG